MKQGKRFFSYIVIGSSLEGMVGATVTAALVERLAIFSLLFLAYIPLEIASRCARALRRR